jgi:predicted nicotinamide N-methyase
MVGGICTASFGFAIPTSDPAVHDLPQLYQKPAGSVLLHALDLVSLGPSNFSASKHVSPKVAEPGVPGYLTSIVSSTLSWIEDEELKDSIWTAASARLSERSGRNAMPSMTRTFVVADATGLDFNIHLHEPTLTQDNLGLKTWSSAVLMSQRLHNVRSLLPQRFDRVLELGAGTGLVGIAAASTWNCHAVLTDLPEILPNLRRNVDLNRDLIATRLGKVETRALDWADEADVASDEENKFMVILAADPIYSPDHPRLLVNAVRRWISWSPQARFVVELPLRDRYDAERRQLRKVLHEMEFDLVAEGTDVGFDDWRGRDGSPAEVTCWWSAWSPISPVV